MLRAKQSDAERRGERRRDEHMISDRHVHRVGSGTVVALGMVSAGVGLLALGRVAGSDATWRAFGVTPLQPPFFTCTSSTITQHALGKDPMLTRRTRAMLTTSTSRPPRRSEQRR